jgi:hypothetical protein
MKYSFEFVHQLAGNAPTLLRARFGTCTRIALIG